MRTLMLFAALLTAGLLQAQAAPAQSDELLLNYESLKSFKADFTQVYYNKMTKKSAAPETGTIQYKAPSFMRFDYLQTAKLVKQIFINDAGVAIIDHDKKAVSRMKGQSESSDYLVFLKGVAEIKKKFTVKKADVALVRKGGIKVEEGQSVFKLSPIAKIPRLRYLFLVMQGKDVRSVAVIDEIGNINQYFFTTVQYDPKVDPSVFSYTVPVGFEVSDL